MKGISLPVETIVIIAIAVLVLVVIAVFFVTGAGRQIVTIEDRNALSNGCVQLATAYGCDLSRLPNGVLSDIIISGYGTLADACIRNGFTEENCRVDACRCLPLYQSD